VLLRPLRDGQMFSQHMLSKPSQYNTMAHNCQDIAAILQLLNQVNDSVPAIESEVITIRRTAAMSEARPKNALIGQDDPIIKVRLSNGLFPDADFPQSIRCLLVAGNETLPEGSNNNNSNNWSARKSRKLLQLYEADSTTKQI
jgi:hypothetical protein